MKKNEGPTPQGLSAKQNMIWNTFGSVVNLASQWLITILIVRLSNGFNAAGLYSLASSIYAIFAPLGQYRMRVYQISDVEGENTLGEYMVLRLLTSNVALVLCVIYSILTCSGNDILAIFLYGLYKTAMLLIEVLHACDQQHYRMDYIGQSMALQGIGSLAAFCVVFIITGSLEFSLAAMTSVVVLIGVTIDLPRTTRFEHIKLKISFSKAKHLLIRCFPIAVAGIAVNAAPSIPRQLLASISGTEALGVYASIAAPIAIIQMGATYIYDPLLSYFSDSFHEGRIRDFVILLGKALLGIACVGIVAIIGIILFAKPVVGLLYGAKSVEYSYLMIPMVPLAVSTGLMWFVNDLLAAVREFRGTFVGGAVSLISALFVMRPMIETFDMNGVTYTGIVSCVLSLVVMSTFLVLRLQDRARARTTGSARGRS